MFTNGGHLLNHYMINIGKKGINYPSWRLYANNMSLRACWMLCNTCMKIATTPLAYINGEHILCFMFHFLKTILSDPETHLYLKKKKNKLYVHSCLTKISEIKKFEKSSFQNSWQFWWASVNIQLIWRWLMHLSVSLWSGRVRYWLPNMNQFIQASWSRGLNNEDTAYMYCSYEHLWLYQYMSHMNSLIFTTYKSWNVWTIFFLVIERA